MVGKTAEHSSQGKDGLSGSSTGSSLMGMGSGLESSSAIAKAEWRPARLDKECECDRVKVNCKSENCNLCFVKEIVMIAVSISSVNLDRFLLVEKD